MTHIRSSSGRLHFAEIGLALLCVLAPLAACSRRAPHPQRTEQDIYWTMRELARLTGDHGSFHSILKNANVLHCLGLTPASDGAQFVIHSSGEYYLTEYVSQDLSRRELYAWPVRYGRSMHSDTRRTFAVVCLAAQCGNSDPLCINDSHYCGVSGVPQPGDYAKSGGSASSPWVLAYGYQDVQPVDGPYCRSAHAAALSSPAGAWLVLLCSCVILISGLTVGRYIGLRA